MTGPTWQQLNLELGARAHAEHTAVTHLRPVLADLVDRELITGWFFIRKTPRWRIRYASQRRTEARDALHAHAAGLLRKQAIAGFVEVVYEPEVHAFGGAESMNAAHRFWHHDSRHLLDYLATNPAPAPGHRRTIAVLLTASMLQAAGLDWYEQGDVWARIAAHRPPAADPHAVHGLSERIRRLLGTDIRTLTAPGQALAALAGWVAAYRRIGQETAALAAAGSLRRGLRDVLAHHGVFAFNRIGLPADAQTVLAHAAADVVFGGTDAHRRHPAAAGRPA